MAPSAFRVERRDDSAVLWFDVPGQAVNTLGAELGKDLDEVLRQIEGDETVRSVVLISGKTDDFIAGADLQLLSKIETAADGTSLSRLAQGAAARLEGFRAPVVAAIHGACLGGGLELALACRARIATKHRKTRLGLPEVKLGVIPGAGGTSRLPKLVGTLMALDLILTGRTVSAEEALRMSLVDEVVDKAVLLDAALEAASKLTRGEEPRRRRRRGWILENPVGRAFLYRRSRKKVLTETHGLMPAPLEAIRAVRRRSPEFESEAFGRLVITSQARNLIGLFFAATELKKVPTAGGRRTRKVGILGAGLMGSGIATVTAAEAGIPVRLKDVDDERVRSGLRRIRESVAARRRFSARERERILGLVSATTDYSGFRRADVVIEAVVEDLQTKRRVLAEVEELGAGDLVFATNTSSIPIDRIAEGCKDPSRVVGMHYFSPVDKVPLLEVIAGPRTSPWVTATAVQLGQAQGKTVIVVRDGPGFYTTRVLAPYLNEAGYLLAEGVPIEEIDRAAILFGFPLGPLKLLDEVGLDVGVKIGHVLAESFGARMAAPACLEAVFKEGRLGRKNGRGFYLYSDKPSAPGASDGKRARKPDPSVYPLVGAAPRRGSDLEETAQRLVLPLVNEAARCVEEGVVASARDADVGAVMGFGFPPFRGGPIRYALEMGAKAVVELLERMTEKHGDRFRPANLLKQWAESAPPAVPAVKS